MEQQEGLSLSCRESRIMLHESSHMLVVARNRRLCCGHYTGCLYAAISVQAGVDNVQSEDNWISPLLEQSSAQSRMPAINTFVFCSTTNRSIHQHFIGLSPISFRFTIRLELTLTICFK